MGKSIQSDGPVSELERILEEKKRILVGGFIETENGINLKKLTREEKEKIKRAIKKKKKKLDKKKVAAEEESSDEEEVKVNKEKIDAVVPKTELDPSIEVEYVEKDEFLLTGKYYDEFKNVFQYFTKPAPALILNKESEEGANRHGKKTEEEQQPEEKPLSRKQRKQLKQLRVAQLKALVKRPDVVEV